MKNIPRTGKRHRPKTAVKGKRYLCAKCRKRSPKAVKTPAPWYCPRCLAAMAEKDVSLIDVGQDHRLADLEPLEALLRAVEGRSEPE